MRICIICHRYPYKDNMVHVFVKKIVDEWALMGHECTVISPLSVIHIMTGKEKAAPVFERQTIANGITVDVHRPRYFTIPKLSFFGVCLNRYCVQRSVENLIKRNKLEFDVIYCHFFKMAAIGWHYAANNDLPFFVATGESKILPLTKPCPSFSTTKMRDTLYGVVAVSTKNKLEAVKMQYANESDIEVFPNGTNIEIFRKMDRLQCRKRLNLPNDKFLIVCVGQFIERKGQRRILEAINLLGNKDIKTIFIGKGDDSFEHESIIFKGTVKNVDLPYYLNAADVFVLPTREEGCCNAIIEALACGLPIISSDKPFNYDVLNRDNSILVNPDDINEIAAAINKLYENRILREDMAQKSLEAGEKLSIGRRAFNIIDFMREKIRQKKKKMKIYYYVYTRKGNLGDLLITKYQIEEYAKYADVFVDCYGMPSDFRNVIFDTTSPRIKDFENEYGIGFRSKNALKVMHILNKNGFTHFCDSPGPRVPLHWPFHMMLRKLMRLSIPNLFLNKEIKRYSLGVDLNYDQHSILTQLNKWHFYKFELLGIRSKQNLHTLEKYLNNVAYVPDMAFLYPQYKSSFFESIRNRIALSFRKVDNYDELVKAVQTIGMIANEHDLDVDILYQVEEDEHFCRQLHDDIKRHNMHFIENPIDFYSLDTYQKYDIVLSNRLHVLLMAAMNGAIPFGLISHNTRENKIKNIFNCVFNRQLVSYIEDFDEKTLMYLYNTQDSVKKEIHNCIEEQRGICKNAFSDLFS